MPPKTQKTDEMEVDLELLIDDFVDLASDIIETRALGVASNIDASKKGLF